MSVCVRPSHICPDYISIYLTTHPPTHPTIHPPICLSVFAQYKQKHLTVLSYHSQRWGLIYSEKTIGSYLDSVPSLTFNTIKTKLIMHAFHSSRYLQPSIPKSHKRSKIIETHFYRLYPIMTGSKIIAGSPSKVWHLILQLLSVFHCQFVVILARVCHICAFLLKKLSHYWWAMADKCVLTLVCG